MTKEKTPKREKATAKPRQTKPKKAKIAAAASPAEMLSRIRAPMAASRVDVEDVDDADECAEMMREAEEAEAAEAAASLLAQTSTQEDAIEAPIQPRLPVDFPVHKSPRWRPRGGLRPNAGRLPALVLDDFVLTRIRHAAAMHCTQEECAAFLGVSPRTFEAFLAENEIARDVWEDGRLNGRISLRRLQWRHAQKNPAMAVHLGKHWLGQRDSGDSDDFAQTIRNIAGELDGRVAVVVERLRATKFSIGVDGRREGGAGLPLAVLEAKKAE